MKYMIVKADTLEDLVKKVNKLMLKGWEPLGAHAVVAWNYRFEWSQVLINQENR